MLRLCSADTEGVGDVTRHSFRPELRFLAGRGVTTANHKRRRSRNKWKRSRKRKYPPLPSSQVLCTLPPLYARTPPVRILDTLRPHWDVGPPQPELPQSSGIAPLAGLLVYWARHEPDLCPGSAGGRLTQQRLIKAVDNGDKPPAEFHGHICVSEFITEQKEWQENQQGPFGVRLQCYVR
jgi:hypothetical protein